MGSDVMRQIAVEKVTLNVGAGSDSAVLEKALRLLKTITGSTPVKTVARKRIPGWGIRPGLPIGCKVTVRGKKANDLLKMLFGGVGNRLSANKFDASGNFSFGIEEYITIPGVEYDVAVGMMGLDVAVTLCRPGYRVKHRKVPSKIGKKHRITKEEAIEFVKSKFGVEVVK